VIRLKLWLLAGAGGIAALAVLAAGVWWALHQAREEGREAGRQECRDAAAAEYRENVNELSRHAGRARAQAAADAAAADRLRGAAERLRGAVAGTGLVIRSAAARGGEAETEAELVSAELLRRAEELARAADDSHRAGQACERSYEALR
jgi:hypothetical protein